MPLPEQPLDWRDYQRLQEKAIRESDQPTYTLAEIQRMGLDKWCASGDGHCHACRHTSWRIFEYVIANGNVQLRFGCAKCGRNATGSSMPFAGINRNHTVKIPLRHRWHELHPCARCSSTTGTELHHWAPSEIFGIESWKWPTSYLCPPCHREWHRKINQARKPRQNELPFHPSANPRELEIRSKPDGSQDD